MREYIPKVVAFLQDNDVCQIQSPECTYEATVVNHTNGRENKRLLDMEYWEASCARCNIYIEEHDVWAREHKHKLFKHQIHNGKNKIN